MSKKKKRIIYLTEDEVSVLIQKHMESLGYKVVGTRPVYETGIYSMDQSWFDGYDVTVEEST